MANQVYANGMEVSCKSGSGKSIAAFPDVCFTPPQAPPTPMGVPIPYPNTGISSDTSNGTRTVKITGKEIMLKDKSYFKTSTGDEAGCAPKKGIITSKIKGKVYFTAWSMDVKFEGENVVRHLDLMTHNHASQGPNTPPWVYLDEMAVDSMSDKCKADSKKTQACMEKHTKQNTHQQKRKDNKLDPATTHAQALADDSKVNWAKIIKDDDGKGEFYNKTGTLNTLCKDPECAPQMECNLVPFDFGCCDGKTPHHIVPAHCFLPSGERKSGAGDRYKGTEKYDDTKAPCICLSGATKSDSNADGSRKEHGLVHAIVDDIEDGYMVTEKQTTPGGKPKMSGGKQVEKKFAGTWNFELANDAGAEAVSQVKKTCDKECLKAQSEAAHKQMGLDVGKGKSDKLMLRADSLGTRAKPGFVPGSTVTAPPSGF